MLVSFAEVIAEIDVRDEELTAWIEQKWVLPVEEGGEYLFDEVDRARVRLIAELVHDLDVNFDAVPVVLRLLDQIYGLRQALDDLNAAVRELPESCQAELTKSLERRQS